MNSSIRDRLDQLKIEIEQIQQEDRAFKKRGCRRASQDIAAHDVGVIRARQILEEINKLMKKPTS